MDKYEYKVRADEIKALIAEGDFAEAVKIADTVDWRRVRSVMMLCTISDLYKINRRYQESKDILLLAYEKHPNGRLIVYSLCELSIKMGEFVQAIEYYKEFVQIAPKDTGRYILQYRLYEAQDVSLEERIAVLEEFKKRDYREKWAYELAYLYHRIGLATKCVEECDEMFLWFGEGKYVVKALELKALHAPLSADQQEKYDAWTSGQDLETAEQEDERPEADEEDDDDDTIEEFPQDTKVAEEIRHSSKDRFRQNQEIADVPTTELPEVKPVDVGQYNTINLQKELAESMKELLGGEEEKAQSIAEAIIAPLLQETAQMPAMGNAAGKDAEKKPPAKAAQPTTKEADSGKPPAKALRMDTGELREAGAQLAKEDTVSLGTQQIINQMKQDAAKPHEENRIPGAKTGTLTPLNADPTEFDKILSQEYDGQISLVVPDAARIEKQITGQLSINDIMAEWEEMKKTNEQKRMEDVRQRILAHTGSLFDNFDEATKNGLLEQLEKAFLSAIMKETDKPRIKKVILPEDVNEDGELKKEPPKTVEKPVEAPAPVQPDQPVAKETLTETDEVEELEEIEEPQETVGAEDNAAKAEEKPEESKEETAAEAKKTDAKSNAEETEAKQESEATPAEAHEKHRTESGRDLTEEEKELFGRFVHNRKSRQQLVNALDNMSLASCTGNVIITGEEEEEPLELAKGLIREMQLGDSNFSGKIAKITGTVLNKKDVAETFARLDNGALIIEKASGLKPQTAAKMCKVLEQDNKGLLVLMTDTKNKINKLLADNASIGNNFNLRIDIEPLNDEALVEYAKQYAEEMEYSIDEFGILALHTRIADRQTSDHEVNLSEIRELVDEAIYYANKKTPKHFMDILLAKRYDEEDMIILREKDFMHY